MDNKLDNVSSWWSTIFWILFSTANIFISYNLNDTLSMLSSERADLLASVNVTPTGRQDVLLFNRVPKAGSTSFVKLLNALGKANDFDFYGYRVENGIDTEIDNMGVDGMQHHAEYLSENCDGNVCGFYKHVHFVDFTPYNLSNPVYVNMVRHPVERVESWYYYIRSTKYIMDTPGFMPVSRLKGTLSDCVEGKWECGMSFEKQTFASFMGTIAGNGDIDTQNSTRKIERIYKDKLEISQAMASSIFINSTLKEGDGDVVDHILGRQKDRVSSQMQYFCGYTRSCIGSGGVDNTDYVLRKAMAVVDKNYAVVGVLEEMEMSYKVFEALIPRFFRNVENIVKHSGRTNSNAPKPALTDKARSILENNLEEEIVFYEFCRQRLYKQFRVLKSLELVK